MAWIRYCSLLRNKNTWAARQVNLPPSDFNFHSKSTVRVSFAVDKNCIFRTRQNKLKAINAISFQHKTFCENCWLRCILITHKKQEIEGKFRNRFLYSIERTKRLIKLFEIRFGFTVCSVYSRWFQHLTLFANHHNSKKLTFHRSRTIYHIQFIKQKLEAINLLSHCLYIFHR